MWSEIQGQNQDFAKDGGTLVEQWQCSQWSAKYKGYGGMLSPSPQEILKKECTLRLN